MNYIKPVPKNNKTQAPKEGQSGTKEAKIGQRDPALMQVRDLKKQASAIILSKQDSGWKDFVIKS